MRYYRSPTELRQADLSKYRYEDMTPEERHELKLRFQEFVSAMKATNTSAPKNPEIQKWNPLDPESGVHKLR